VLCMSLAALRMLSEGSIERIKSVVDARPPPGLRTARRREEQRCARCDGRCRRYYSPVYCGACTA
jgi:hypothetical protein